MPERFVIPVPTPGPYSLGPDSQRHAAVPRGTVTKHTWRSAIFPDTERDYWVYVPSQYTADVPANVMVFQDGGAYVAEEGPTRVPIVFDNLIHQRKMPVTIAILIDPGRRRTPTPPPAANESWTRTHEMSQRSFEYDTLSDQYARFLLEEILPAVAERHRLTNRPESRAICGASSGGICAFTVAWQRPDAFGKVLSHVGSFTDIRGGHVYPTLVRKTMPRKPIRVFLQGASNDLDCEWGSWALGNLEMAAALEFAGYDYRLVYGDGPHDTAHAGAILPESLVWLWR